MYINLYQQDGQQEQSGATMVSKSDLSVSILAQVALVPGRSISDNFIFDSVSLE